MKKVFYRGNVTPEQILNELFELGRSRKITEVVLSYLEKLIKIKENLQGHVVLTFFENGTSTIRVECDVLEVNNAFVLVKTTRTQCGKSVDLARCEKKIFFITPTQMIIGVEVLEKSFTHAPAMIDDEG